ncbi:MAG: hypothetical protein HQL43_14220 [Alphaproteobacteria bacterium]|nr:hypothetical protein [Alphaproteobacteria bacterium]
MDYMVEGSVFNAEIIRGLKSDFFSISRKQEELSLGYLSKNFNHDRAKEFAHHGLLRRLKTIVRCIENIFHLVPPERHEPPSREGLSDAEINLQAFAFNVFGCLDNLAWIYAFESGLKDNNLRPLRDQWVGLRRENSQIRESLTPDFRSYLESMDSWFDHLQNYRHALAHRIPLYIPPYIVTAENENAFRILGDKMNEAIQKRDYEAWSRLSRAQDALGVFRPWIMHSFREEANPVWFHAQILADFNTIYEIGRKMLEELDRYK